MAVEFRRQRPAAVEFGLRAEDPAPGDRETAVLGQKALLGLTLMEGAEDFQADEAGQFRQSGIDDCLGPEERHGSRTGRRRCRSRYGRLWFRLRIGRHRDRRCCANTSCSPCEVSHRRETEGIRRDRPLRGRTIRMFLTASCRPDRRNRTSSPCLP